MHRNALIQLTAMEVGTFFKVTNKINHANFRGCMLKGLVSAKSQILGFPIGSWHGPQNSALCYYAGMCGIFVAATTAISSKADTIFCSSIYSSSPDSVVHNAWIWTKFPILIWLTYHTNNMVSNVKYHAPSSNGGIENKKLIFHFHQLQSQQNIFALEQSFENLK